jgi:hypothetical protein
MKKIITLTGHKDCKKDLLAEDLAKNSAVGVIPPYTDKKLPISLTMDYIEVSKEKLDELIEKNEVLSETMIDGNRYVYFTSQLEYDYNILIVDDYALVDVKEHYPDKEIYLIKVYHENQKDSDRVGVYMYDHEFDKVFHYGTDDFGELEWEIEEYFE